MNRRILVVEDDQYIRESLKDLLESEGYIVSCAVNGQDALDELARSEVPALILLDLMMPVKDGFQFRNEMARNPAWANVPIVIMSADGHVHEKLVRIRAHAYLKKPVEIDDVLEVAAKFAS
jgi:CheY-like chemotaxis protein